MSTPEQDPAPVDDRRFEQACEELGGRATPPDRTAEILARVAAGVDERAGGGAQAGGFKLLVAAALLLGLGVTVLAWRMSAASGAAGGESGDEVAQVEAPTPAGDGAESADGGTDPLPKGTDPADLAAMRSAAAMLAAEEKLRQMIAAGRIAGVDRVLPFEELDGWAYTEGLAGAPAEVRALDGQQVLMLGFMLPLDEVEGMREFLLVSSLWSCCYGTPPDVHGIVRCRMAAGRRVDYQFEPVKVVGRFSVRETREDGYCVDVFQLDVELLEVVE